MAQRSGLVWHGQKRAGRSALQAGRSCTTRPSICLEWDKLNKIASHMVPVWWNFRGNVEWTLLKNEKQKHVPEIFGTLHVDSVRNWREVGAEEVPAAGVGRPKKKGGVVVTDL
eukprot:4691766-Amphidinium_carterae.1